MRVVIGEKEVDIIGGGGELEKNWAMIITKHRLKELLRSENDDKLVCRSN